MNSLWIIVLKHPNELIFSHAQFLLGRRLVLKLGPSEREVAGRHGRVGVVGVAVDRSGSEGGLVATRYDVVV